MQVLLWNNSLDKALIIQYIALYLLYAPPIVQASALKKGSQKNRVFWGTLCEFLELILDLPKCGIISPISLLNVDVKNSELRLAENAVDRPIHIDIFLKKNNVSEVV